MGLYQTSGIKGIVITFIMTDGEIVKEQFLITVVMSFEDRLYNLVFKILLTTARTFPMTKSGKVCYVDVGVVVDTGSGSQ